MYRFDKIPLKISNKIFLKMNFVPEKIEKILMINIFK